MSIASKTFDESLLWDTANKLRGTVESSEYKHVVLSLIFLKFASDKFAEREQELIDAGQEAFLDMVEFYTMKNVFYLPEAARWLYIQANAKQPNIALLIDTALSTLEKNNKALRGALPDNYFSRLGLDTSKLAALIDTISNIDTLADKENDVVGRVYEYFLGKFAAAEGKLGGEFYTPKCVVNLIAEMIEPYKGKIYDPCCGSGGMFVQSIKFVESHHGNKKDISIYGQEYTGTTYKLAKMNLAIRSISGNLGEVPADTFFKDQHPDLKADYIMANPPFNQKDWRGADELVNDPRWSGYEVPPTGNANYAWILHMLSKLSAQGVAGFVMANGSMSTNTNSESEIRKRLIENDVVDCMIALPGQLFFTTQIPVCLWFLTKSKAANSERDFRDRRGETLFIDARNMGSMIDRTHKELTTADIAEIADTYHRWRSVGADLCVCPSSNVGATTNRANTQVRPYNDVPDDMNGIIDGANPITNRANTQVRPYNDVPNDVNPIGNVPDDVGADLRVCPNAGGIENNVTDTRNNDVPDDANGVTDRANTQVRPYNDVPNDANPIGNVPNDVGADLRVCPSSNVGATTNRANTQVRPYVDIAGFCKSATLEEIRANDYVLTPGRYVGAAVVEDDGIAFETKMAELSQALYAQMQQAQALDAVIRLNLEGLGYGE
ncbi:MAG: class I SAM-dependent DNA methyltransferase [Candidatus Thiocaldithrix dubininis]|uniref:site-specific DNA-methyltransferase (adenine-specific) n=1 Tax=Candidatus Thiocaldithrix dubininis TaxID=3080823 RepID=A0AA95KDX2_9GAMM|nr:MAG: class I SAM-dependent DNA methyltransferase [Candidatus Thiocaldithrix dubininis]